VNVSAGVQRTMPRALVLALLVGGTSAFVTQEHQEPPDGGAAPGHQRVDQDLAAETAAAAAAADAAELVTEALPVQVPDPLAPPAPVPVALPVPVPASGPTVAKTGASPQVARPRGRHAHRGRPADSGRSAMRWAENGDRRPRSHRRDMDVPETYHATGTLNWSALARCEAGGNPHAVDPSGRYGGLYQFDAHTWHSLGGRGRPQDAPAAEQTERAVHLYQQRGIAPWPACGRRADG
jgi:hypothetical protein